MRCVFVSRLGECMGPCTAGRSCLSVHQSALQHSSSSNAGSKTSLCIQALCFTPIFLVKQGLDTETCPWRKHRLLHVHSQALGHVSALALTLTAKV